MFGRVRAPSSSPDALQRPSSKILKHDSLSVYEATLMKLKLGSQRSLDDSMETESNSSHVNAPSGDVDEKLITILPNCSTVTSVSTLSQSDAIQRCGNNFSVIYMFSKYNNSRNGLVSSCEEIMAKAGNGFASPCSSCEERLSDDSTKERCQHESISPTSVRHF